MPWPVSVWASCLVRRGRLFAGCLPLFVGGIDPGLPAQKVTSEGFDLLFALALYDVVTLLGILREVEVLIGLVAVVVDVLLVVLYAREARADVVAARHKGAVLRRIEHRGSGVGPAIDPVPQQVAPRRQDVEFVPRRLDPLAALPSPGLVDDERYVQPLVVDGVVVLFETVLVEPLPVVAENDEGRVLV